MKTWSSLLLMAMLAAPSLAADPPPDAGTALITGSDRGIGFALVQEFDGRGWQVIATTRDPAKATALKFALDAGARRSVITVLMSPGAVDTDMQRVIRSDQAKAGKPITAPTRTPEEVARALVLAIEELEPGQNGRFISITGKEVPW
jgi:NAD(P)-dependent dehydrogenase (short-subunit alcohol dehydrogenase family)